MTIHWACSAMGVGCVQGFCPPMSWSKCRGALVSWWACHTKPAPPSPSLSLSLTLAAPPLARPAFSQPTPSTTSSLVQHAAGTPQFQKITSGESVYPRSRPGRWLDKCGWCNPSKHWLGSRWGPSQPGEAHMGSENSLVTTPIPAPEKTGDHSPFPLASGVEHRGFWGDRSVLSPLKGNTRCSWCNVGQPLPSPGLRSRLWGEQ